MHERGEDGLGHGLRCECGWLWLSVGLVGVVCCIWVCWCVCGEFDGVLAHANEVEHQAEPAGAGGLQAVLCSRPGGGARGGGSGSCRWAQQPEQERNQLRRLVQTTPPGKRKGKGGRRARKQNSRLAPRMDNGLVAMTPAFMTPRRPCRGRRPPSTSILQGATRKLREAAVNCRSSAGY